MSARDLPVVLSPRARRDLQSALLFTRRQWGERERRRYRHTIDRALAMLSANPELGRRRDEFFLGCRSFPVGQHLIYYRVAATEIEVSRILHAHQDAAGSVAEHPAPEPD